MIRDELAARLRSLDAMSEAIALSSPSGHVSGRARRAARARLNLALFGPGGLQKPKGSAQLSEAILLRHQASELRELASRGMRSRAYAKRAAELEVRADALEGKR